MNESLHVYQDANLVKQLNTLMKKGAGTAQVARHAQAIIDRITDEGIHDPKLIGRLTRNGEARIRNCVKFDLVRSYRLVGKVLDHGIAFLYVGSHDECDHWIRNNAGAEPVLDKKRSIVVAVKKAAAMETTADGEPDADSSEFDYDEMLLRDLTEQDLRKIFCGLVKR
jgi:hypothetical protein